VIAPEIRGGRTCADFTKSKDAESGGGGDDGGGGKDDGGGGGRYSVLVQYHAPCIMPWLWDEAAPSADPRMRPSHISLRAGSRRAFCPEQMVLKHQEVVPVTDAPVSHQPARRQARCAGLWARRACARVLHVVAPCRLCRSHLSSPWQPLGPTQPYTLSCVISKVCSTWLSAPHVQPFMQERHTVVAISHASKYASFLFFLLPAGAIVVMCPPEHESDTEATESEDSSQHGSVAGASPKAGAAQHNTLAAMQDLACQHHQQLGCALHRQETNTCSDLHPDVPASPLACMLDVCRGPGQ
jgi:hypothetical protein